MSKPKSQWPEPSEITIPPPPVRSFTEEMIPEVFRGYVAEAAQRMAIPLDYPLACALVFFSSAVQRRIRIQPKELDYKWRVVPNLWGGLIGDSGAMKSGVISAMAEPLYTIQSRWESAIAVRREQGAPQNHLREMLDADLDAEILSDPPARLRQLITNDTTYPAVQDRLIDNPAGMLILSDELSGWWASLDRRGNEKERGFFLESWNGDVPRAINRVKSGYRWLPGLSLSVFGGITPDRLRSYLTHTLRGDASNDGLPQRFQAMVWSDVTPIEYVDCLPAKHLGVEQAFQRVLKMDPEEPRVYRFTAAGQEYFKHWWNSLHTQIADPDLHPAMRSHLTKFRSLMPAIAGLYSLADAPEEDLIDQRYLAQSADCCAVLATHAGRTYSCIRSPRVHAAQKLAEKLRQRLIGAEGFFHLRDVYRPHWADLADPASARAAVEILRDNCWVEHRNVSTKGRPEEVWLVNPRIYGE